MSLNKVNVTVRFFYIVALNFSVNNSFMATLYRKQPSNLLRSSCGVPDIFVRFNPGFYILGRVLIVSNVKFHKCPSSVSRTDTCGWTDSPTNWRQTRRSQWALFTGMRKRLENTWSVRKVSDLWPGKRNWLTWSVGHLITLKVVPLGLHTLLPAVLPLLEACRKSLFRNGV